MIRALLFALDKYGLQVTNLLLLAFVSWKFATNHFKHLTDTVEEIKVQGEKISEKVDILGERVAHLEGKTE